MRDKTEDFVVTHIENRGNREVKVGHFYCVLNNKVYNTLGGLRNAVKPKMTIKEYYDVYYKAEHEGICYCGNETSFDNVIDGYSKFCSNACHCKTDEHRNIVKNRFVGDPEKLQNAVAKMNSTNANKSVDKLMQEREKRNATIIEKYGETYFSERVKKQWANRSDADIKALVKKANYTKRENGTFDTSSRFAYKKFNFGDFSFYCQGYEIYVLEFLINEYGIDPSQIATGKDVPRVFYSGNKGKFHRPDIYIKDYDLYVEVKSEYTYLNFKDEVHQKQKSTIDVGAKHLIFAINMKYFDMDKIALSRVLDMTISSQAYSNDRKVQRLSGDTEYRPNVYGSGSAKVPNKLGM